MGQSVKVVDLKEANIFINDNDKLEQSPKTLAAIIGGSLDRLWVKYKDTLHGNTEAVVQILPKSKKYTFIKKHEAAASRKKELVVFIAMLEELGYTKS